MSYHTVELEYLCIMCAGCIGYRQNLEDSKCWPKLNLPHGEHLLWQVNVWLMEKSTGITISQSGLRIGQIEKMGIPIDSSWETSSQHYPALIWPKPEIPCPLNLYAGGGFQASQIRLVGPKLARKKVSPQTPLPRKNCKQVLAAVAAA